MTEIGWLEQTKAGLPLGDDWLGESERSRGVAFRFPKRRDDWRLGRWTAKRAVALRLSLPADPETLAKLEIRAATDGAPEVYLENEPAGVTISISHRAGVAVCAVAPSSAALGCDVELIEPRSEAFLADYFTAEEEALVAREPIEGRVRLLSLLWSAKESALKALRCGLRLDTRCVSVLPEDAPYGELWRPLQVHYSGRQVFNGWWGCSGTLVRTVVAAPPPRPPMTLACSGDPAQTRMTSSWESWRPTAALR